MSLEFMTVPFEVKELKEVTDNDIKYGLIKGYGSTFGNIDETDDIIEKGAFKKTLKDHKKRNRQIRMMWQHDRLELIGGWDKYKEDDRGLLVEGKINLEVQRGKEAYALAKQGVLSDLSIGFSASSTEWIKKNGRDIRVLKEIELFEISPVGNPANREAMITDVKGAVPFSDLPLASRERAWDSTAAIKRVRAFTDSEEEASSRYRRAFFLLDSSEFKNFESYKLPFADVIDGKLTAVPRGIFAAAGAIQGARGGVDISEADKTKVRRVIEKYYKKMDLESPFKNSITEISNFLKSFGMSNSDANDTIYRIKSLPRNENSDNEPRNECSGLVDEIIIGTKLDQLINNLKHRK
jgi:HK97 family phage prohead protease